MGISIYYTATRAAPITLQEDARIGEVIREYSVDSLIERYLHTGEGLNWESFTVYAPPPRDPDVVFEGATRLPDNRDDAVWTGVQHWCRALTRIRCILPDADWKVTVDDHPIQWDAERAEYDPNQ